MSFKLSRHKRCNVKRVRVGQSSRELARIAPAVRGAPPGERLKIVRDLLAGYTAEAIQKLMEEIERD
jgi:hypothetical protein